MSLRRRSARRWGSAWRWMRPDPRDSAGNVPAALRSRHVRLSSGAPHAADRMKAGDACGKGAAGVIPPRSADCGRRDRTSGSGAGPQDMSVFRFADPQAFSPAFGRVSDSVSAKTNSVCFRARLFVSSTSSLDTPSRQKRTAFVSALDFSYLCYGEKVWTRTFRASFLYILLHFASLWHPSTKNMWKLRS